MNKFNAKPANPPMSKVSFGNYGAASIFVPAAKLGELINLLAHCKIVTTEWIDGCDYADVLMERKVEIDLQAQAPISRDEYNAIREAIKAEKEAAEKEAAKYDHGGLLIESEDIGKLNHV